MSETSGEVRLTEFESDTIEGLFNGWQAGDLTGRDVERTIEVLIKFRLAKHTPSLPEGAAITVLPSMNPHDPENLKAAARETALREAIGCWRAEAEELAEDPSCEAESFTLRACADQIEKILPGRCSQCSTGIWCGDGACSQWTDTPAPPGEGDANG